MYFKIFNMLQGFYVFFIDLFFQEFERFLVEFSIFQRFFFKLGDMFPKG